MLKSIEACDIATRDHSNINLATLEETGPLIVTKSEGVYVTEIVVGVVTAAQGQRWYDIVLDGQEAHAGPTAMETRKDAMVGASRLILEVDLT